jgi:hypothetical protein
VIDQIGRLRRRANGELFESRARDDQGRPVYDAKALAELKQKAERTIKAIGRALLARGPGTDARFSKVDRRQIGSAYVTLLPKMQELSGLMSDVWGDLEKVTPTKRDEFAENLAGKMGLDVEMVKDAITYLRDDYPRKRLSPAKVAKRLIAREYSCGVRKIDEALRELPRPAKQP